MKYDDCVLYSMANDSLPFSLHHLSIWK